MKHTVSIERGRLAACMGIALAASACSGAPADVDSETTPSAEVGEVVQSLTESDLYFDVPIRGTGSVSIHANVYENPHAGYFARTVIAVHGFTETANVWAPLADAIFEEAPRGKRVKRIISIDLPGHGESGFPENTPDGSNFGALVIEDYIGVVIASIDTLAAQGLGPQAIYGHSMGGLIVQGVQQTLLDQGSSLADHGVHRAVLIAPVPAHDQQWNQSPTGDVSPFIVFDPVNGTYLDLPAAVFQASSFGTLGGTLAPNAPSIAEIDANGYVGIEPLTVALQLTETPFDTPAGPVVIPRPSVEEGAFGIANGTLLAVLGFTQDILVPASDLPPLYDHLTGHSHGLLSITIDKPDAVHSMYVSNPEGLIEALHEML